jgi:hypothetical protein
MYEPSPYGFKKKLGCQEVPILHCMPIFSSVKKPRFRLLIEKVNRNQIGIGKGESHFN